MAATTTSASRKEKLAATTRKIEKKRALAESRKGMRLILAVQERRRLPALLKTISPKRIAREVLAVHADPAQRSAKRHRELTEVARRNLKRLGARAEGKFLIRSVKAQEEGKRHRAAAKRLPALVAEDKRKTAARTAILRERDRKRRAKTGRK